MFWRVTHQWMFKFHSNSSRCFRDIMLAPDNSKEQTSFFQSYSSSCFDILVRIEVLDPLIDITIPEATPPAWLNTLAKTNQ